MMAVEAERAAPTLGSRLVAAVAGSSVCISSLQSSTTSAHHHPSPPSPAPSSSSSSEGSDGRGLVGFNGRMSPGGQTEVEEHIDPVATTMSTTQATLTVSVHSRPASPIQRRVHGESYSNATGNSSPVVADDDMNDVDVDSPPPSPLSPGDERRRSPTPPGLRGSSRGPESPASCSSPPSVDVNAAEQRRRAAEERVSSPVVVVAPSNNHHLSHNRPEHQAPAPGPVRLTNFSIDAILKSNFGAPAATRRDHRKQASTSGSTARALDVANLVATTRHYSPHGIDHLVHGQKYIQQRNSSLLQGNAFTSGRAQGFVPYHPAGSRRAGVTPSSPPAARSPPLHPAHSSSAASSSPSPSFTYPEPGPAAGPTTTGKTTTLSSRSHHHHPYLEAHHHHHHSHHPHHHPTPLHHSHHLSHHHPHHHHNPRSPGVNSSSASSPSASPGGASSISSTSSCSPPTSSGGPRSPALLKTPVPNGGDGRGGSPGGASRAAGAGSADGATSTTSSATPGAVDPKDPLVWPAWVYCTRYSDRPSSGRRKRRAATSTQDSELADPWEGPRARKPSSKKEKEKLPVEKRPRTAFTNEQLARLKREFDDNRYLTETRRQDLAKELGLNESQIKIWFQNKRAKMKKATGVRNGLAIQLMAQGLYNHSTVPVNDDTGSESAGSPSKSS